MYVSVRGSVSQPDRMVVNEMRRDSNPIFQNEGFGVAFDTFYDRRNAGKAAPRPTGGAGRSTSPGVAWTREGYPLVGREGRKEVIKRGRSELPPAALWTAPGVGQRRDSVKMLP